MVMLFAMTVLLLSTAKAQCPPVVVTSTNPYTEGFEGSTACWTTEYVDGTVDWEVVSDFEGGSISTPHGGTYCQQFMYYSYGAISRLISPTFDLSAIPAAELHFWHIQEDWAGDQNTLAVYYRTDPAGSWTLLGSFDQEIDQWTEEVYTITNVSSTVQFSFVGDGEYGYAIGLDDITVCAPPTCILPTDLQIAGITTTSATLSWTDVNTSPLGYEIELNGNIFPVSTNPTTLTLTPSTAYDVRVRTFCTASDISEWSAYLHFSSACDNVVLTATEPYVQDFSETTFPPTCWSQSRTDVGTGSYGPNYPDGAWARYTYNQDGNNTPMAQLRDSREGSKHALVSPSFDFTYTGGYQLSVDFYRGYGDDDEGVLILVGNNPAIDGTCDTLCFISNSYEATSNIGGNIIPVEEESGWYTYELPILNRQGTNYIIFEGHSQYYTSSYMDNVIVRQMPTCARPTSVVLNTATTTTAEISWVSNGSETLWEIEVDGTTIVTANSNPFTLTGLTTDADHTVRVRALCSTLDMSEWSNPISFHLGICAPAPVSVDGQGFTRVVFGQDIVVDNTTHSTAVPVYGDYSNLVGTVSAGTQATVEITMSTGYTYGTVIWVNWNNDIYFTDDEVVYTGESSSAEPTTLTCSFMVPANTPLGTYRMRIGSGDYFFDDAILDNQGYEPCGQASYLIYEDYMLQITEAPSCLIPYDVVVSGITEDGATISWTTDGDETSWLVAYGDTSVVVNTNPYTITGLAAQTAYDVRVAALCSATDTSYFSVSAHFTTLCGTIFITNADPYNEGFEGEDWGCWNTELVSGDENWELDDYAAHSGMQGAYFSYWGNQARLISPLFDMTGITTQPLLAFWYKLPAYMGAVEEFSVLYRTSVTDGWTELANYNTAVESYTADTLVLPAGTVQVCFLATGHEGNGLNLDDISIFADIAPCDTVTDITIDEYATIRWTSDAASWNIRYTINGEEHTVHAANNIYTIGGLADGDVVTVSIQAICEDNRVSEWSETSTFTYSTGVNEYNALNANIYPNPTRDIVNVDCSVIGASLNVYDMFGKVVMSTTIQSERTELNFNNVAPGVYVIRIANSNAMTTVKVVKE